MKKIVALLLSLSMIAGIAACNTPAGTETSSEASDSTKETTADDTEETGETTIDRTQPGYRETWELFDGAFALDYTFEDPEKFPWSLYTESGGKGILACEDGHLVLKIENPGTVTHACQVYHDGFSMYQNAEYQVDFDIWSDVERDFEWRIQLNGGDYHAYYLEDKAHMGTEPTHIQAVFTMYEPSDPAPRFAFNLGNQVGSAHNVYIDNLSMQVLNSSNAVDIEPLPPANPIAVNQTGYRPDDPKSCFIDCIDDSTFDIVDVETDKVVYTGDLSEPINCRGALANIKQGDFSDFKEPGTYVVRTATSGDSYKFTIAKDVYNDALKASILMLYTQRCGCEVTDEKIGEDYKDFTHPACHTGEALIYGTDTKIDVSGGWHDAGDYGRYVAPGAKAVADLLMTYTDTGYKSDKLGIPESGNGTPDILDEARYELDWMFKMQDPATGGVYHKVTCANFPATVMPEEETDQLLVLPISTTATGDFAAAMAMAARVYKPFDKKFADKCLEAAKKAYAYMEANAEADKTGFINPDDVATGEYPDASNKDEFFWAAIELFVTTGDNAYLEKAKSLYTVSMELGLGWIEMGLYGIHSYLLSDKNSADSEFTEELKARILDEVKIDLVSAKRDGYYNKMASFPWGSNLTISNNGILYYLGYLLTNDKEYRDLTYYQVDYIMGMNITGYSFLTGFGEHAAENPHHRPSQNKGHAVPGMVVGGPNGKPEDPYAISVLMGLPGARCYVDNDTCYSINEVAIYWNSPFVYILAAKVQNK
ncbi:MAG: glycoside hydrolase family 9 protein [Clostridiales bacterium]|nr:glycoside hydrolase family 9 protein [Clostridiales bacterium]